MRRDSRASLIRFSRHLLASRGDVERLFALLEELGDARTRTVLQRALFQRLIGAEYVVRLAARLEEVAS